MPDQDMWGNPLQDDSDKKDKSLAGIAAESGIKSAASSFGSKLTEAVTDRFLNAVGGRHFAQEQEQEKVIGVEEKAKEKEQEESSLLQMYHDRASMGHPIDDKTAMALTGSGTMSANVIRGLNQTAQDVQNTHKQFDDYYKKGAFGDPSDPQTKQQYMQIKAMMGADPKVAAGITEVMKMHNKMLEQLQKAVLQAKNIHTQEALIHGNQTSLENQRNRNRLGQIGAAGNVRLNVGEKLQTHEAGLRETVGEKLQDHAEKLKEKTMQLGAKLKGITGSSAATKALDSVGKTIDFIATGRAATGKGMGEGGEATDEETRAAVAPAMLDSVNNNFLSTPNMTFTKAMSGAGFAAKSSKGLIVGEGIENFVQDAARKGLMDQDAASAWINSTRRGMLSQKNEETAAALMMRALDNLPPDIRDQVKEQYKRMLGTIDDARAASQQTSSDDTSLPDSGVDAGAGMGTSVNPMDESDDEE